MTRPLAVIALTVAVGFLVMGALYSDLRLMAFGVVVLAVAGLFYLIVDAVGRDEPPVLDAAPYSRAVHDDDEGHRGAFPR